MPPEFLERRADPVLGPILWDLTHLAVYEDLWGVGAVLGPRARVTDDALATLYDAFEQPRPGRCDLPLLGLEASLGLQDAVRERTLAGLERPGDEAEPRLGIGGFVHLMIAQHEAQHAETMLQALARFGVTPGRLRARATPPSGDVPADEVPWIAHEGGRAQVGRDTGGPYDNEFPAHAVQLEPFALEALPVSNARFAAFVEAGGYRRQEWWTPAGWAWREREGVDLPLDWRRDVDGSFWVRRFGRVDPLDPREPVQHVSAHEADAFARFSGARLPSEAEWEHAARTTPELDLAAELPPVPGPRPLPRAHGRHPQAQFGWVYEWTASEFDAYPGFASFPYREYSAVFFRRGYRALRGCSWAAWPLLARATYRNWDRPERRQLFAGLRLARDL